MFDGPIAYSTHYNFPKWALGANPGADALNEDLIEVIDTAIYEATQTTSSQQVAKLGIGGLPDDVYKLKVYGDTWLTGNIKIDGVAAIGGAVDTNFKLKIHGDQKITGNLTVDGNFYIGGSINQVNVVDLDVADHAIRLNKGGDNTTALDGGIEMLGTGDALIGSIKYTGASWLSDLDFNLASGKVYKINDVEVISSTTLGANIVNSSLTKVGTLTQGVWNATVINGQYINYNTTNLKVTSNQLNTIQDVATVSSPTFAQLTLSNAATTTVQAVRADRTINTTAPITGGGNLTADRTFALSYNTTNLKLTSNQLNTIQDIATTSSPIFADITLSGRLDQQGTTNSEFGSQSVLPKQSYYGNLGAINKKWLTLHAAELWVETLVAQDTIATIGGRVLVGPTTTLVSDLSAGSTTINVKHNQMVNGDVVYMEANGKIEFIRINSSYSGSAGNYYYSVIRNLDGTGANDWYAGDAMFNTGQAGNGFIDLYSLRGIKSASQAGPTIVGNVRNSTTYNDWNEHWAIGNLNNLYGYTSNIYGVGFGKYANSSSFLTADSTYGIRLRYKDSGGSVVDKITLDMSGNVYIANYLQVGTAAADVNNGSTTITGSKITTGTITLSHLNFTPVQTSNVVASINASAEGITINGSKLTINSSTTFASGYDPTTKITTGGAADDVNNNTTTINGGKITTNTITLSHLNFTPVQTSNVVASINASAEGIGISATKLSITGTTTFFNGNTLAQNINAGTTTINGGKITTSSITLSHLNFTPVQTSNVVASINATAEGITINANRLNLTGVLAVGTAANDVNTYSTTISGNKIRSGVIQSNNWNTDAGSYYDLVNGTITLGGSSSPKFTVNSAGEMTATGGTIASMNFDYEWMYIGTKANPTMLWNIPNCSIYVRPLLTNLKLVFFGQTHRGTTSGGTPAWSGHYGINAIDNSNRWIFTLDDEYRQIAGWNFDYEKFTKGSSSAGFSLNTSSTAFITGASSKGFEVYDVSNPKMFCGVRDGSGNLSVGFDWNVTGANKMTYKGEILASQFSSTTTLDESSYYNGVIIKSNYIRLADFSAGTGGNMSYLHLSPFSIAIRGNGGGGSIISDTLMRIDGSSSDFVKLTGFNVPKFLGVTNSPSSTNRKAGDFFLGTTGTLGVWNGSSFWYYNHN